MYKNFILMFCTGAFLLIASCNEKPAEGKYEFYYYPSVNMYYDVVAGQYIYSIDSAKTWKTVNQNSAEPPVVLGESITILSESKEIWTHNEYHRQTFNGTIFNIVKTATTDATAANEVSERKVVKPIEKPVVEEPKKKGLGKFINNLFKKKKKEEDGR